MFEIPQPATIAGEEKQKVRSDQTRDGIPIIAMYDDRSQVCGKDVLEFVLNSCHPACLQSSRPSLPAHMVGSIVDVATRYSIDWAIKAAIHDPDLLKSHPFMLFAHACHKGLEAEAVLAATETLRFSIEDFPHEPALKLISGYQYHTLLEFHKRCGKEAAAIARGRSTDWVQDRTLRLFPASHDRCSSLQDVGNPTNRWNALLGLPANEWHTTPNSIFPKIVMQTGHRGLGKFSCQMWWIEYMESTATALESRPHSSTVDDPKRIDAALKEAASCEICAGEAYSFMKSFIFSFEQKIEAVIREISDQSTFV